MNNQAKRTHSANGLWLVDKSKYAILPENLPDLDKKTEILLKMTASGVSRGTERLVFNARVPMSEYQRMLAPHQRGDFPYPVQYGYCATAEILDGPPELIGKFVFSLHPHQDYFITDSKNIALIPAHIPPQRAVLAANMETALNGLWDSGVSAGDHVTIVGGGVLGLLLAFLIAQIPATDVTLIDTQDRSRLAESFGVRFEQEPQKGLEADLVFHTSASESGLQTAISCAGSASRIIEMSWYGDRETSLSLGGAFHSKRLQLISSQVGKIPNHQKERWTYARRMQKALELLDDARLDQLLTHQIPFLEAASRLPPLLDDPKALAITLLY
jgi:threonine dehydrogenase-like Zn-dependent dehydrogenase